MCLIQIIRTSRALDRQEQRRPRMHFALAIADGSDPTTGSVTLAGRLLNSKSLPPLCSEPHPHILTHLSQEPRFIVKLERDFLITISFESDALTIYICHGTFYANLAIIFIKSFRWVFHTQYP